jgi:aminoglycoside 6'-N-acetyltransferase I
MRTRLLAPEDRSEWLRMLEGLYAGTNDADHVRAVDAYLSGRSISELVPAAVLVAERSGGGLCGFLELSLRNYAEGCVGETPYIESWFVDQDQRRCGVGSALVSAAEAWARSLGYRELASDSLLENDVSQAAHRALGFEELERSVHYRKPL